MQKGCGYIGKGILAHSALKMSCHMIFSLLGMGGGFGGGFSVRRIGPDGLADVS
jgi:hypothetical protein